MWHQFEVEVAHNIVSIYWKCGGVKHKISIIDADYTRVTND